ncbi:MAG TPA: molybdopterin cofactor-binding domain-containing protein, partial [Acidimicrobiales bacterium]|nr:molybdopterin cofactor-binding domain-containing protein [Acidimicrobiales bacterium]
RRKNFIRPEDFPYTASTGLVHDSGDYGAVLDTALTIVGYGELREEQSRRRSAGGPWLGIGLATFVDRTAGVPGGEYGSVELTPAGGALVRTGSTPYGQGHRTSWAMLVAERTGIPIEDIQVVYGDTDVIPRSGVTGGSRSVQKAGAAVALATDQLVLRARNLASELLEAAVEDVVLDVAAGGRFHVAGTPSLSIGWREVAEGAAGGRLPGLRCEADADGEATVPFGAYVAVVEVDAETGAVKLLRLVTVDDAGRILNPLIAAGQVHGGAAQGIGQSLLEQFEYDLDGNPLTPNFIDYPLPSATELPLFETSFVETPSPNNVLGAKGLAESGTIGAPPAVQNAVVDAVRHLGVTHIDMPCTPERVWSAIRRGR